MHGFIKFAIATGLIGLIVLFFAMKQSDKIDTQIEKTEVKAEQKAAEFDKDFEADWNRDKAAMAGSNKERNHYLDKAKTAEKVYGDRAKAAEVKVAALDQEEAEKKAVLKDLQDSFTDVARDMDKQVSDADFQKAIDKHMKDSAQ